MKAFNSRISTLALKNIDENLTCEELSELETLLAEAGKDHLLEFILNKHLMVCELEKLKAVDTESAWQKMHQKISPQPHSAVYGLIFPLNLRNINRRHSVAAAIFLTLLGSIAYFSRVTRQDPPTGPNHAKNDILPASPKADLVLANGRSINLAESPDGFVARQGDFEIFKTNDSIHYKKADAPGTSKDSGFNEIKVPRSGAFHVILSDGTYVLLNANTSLKLPVTIDTSARNVETTGEAYFDVVHNDIPFIVKAGNSRIEVMGTRFNIRAYNDKQVVKATLLDGKIKVSRLNEKGEYDGDKELKPGQQAVIDDKGRISINLHADTMTAIGWTSGKFLFVSTDVKTIMDEIGRWYNVEVHYIGDVEKVYLNCDISRNYSLDSTIDQLNKEIKNDINIDRKGNKLTVSKNP